MTPELEDYVLGHSDGEDPLLAVINRYTHSEVLNPNMLSGPVLGKLLEMLSAMIKPRNILEIGTYTGYSALCLVRGLLPGGTLHTIEVNDELKEIAGSFFSRSEFSDSIHLHIGNALEVIPDLPGPFDLVFIDGEKEEYTAYYKLVLDKIPVGGYIIADNVLWGGKVVGNDRDRSTEGIRQFNNTVQEDPTVRNLLLPVRDGIMLIRKTG